MKKLSTPTYRSELDGAVVVDFAPATELEKDLHYTLSYKRPHGSLEEMNYVLWLTERITAAGCDWWFDSAGNVFAQVGENTETMFTSHTDTVHGTGGQQELEYSVATNGDLFVRTKDTGVLGADDGTGCVLMLEMMRRGVTGLYAFFRGEEVGCEGSGAFAKSDYGRTVLRSIKRAVAFDRAGYSDVVVSQRSSECCSPEFAAALCDALSDDKLIFMDEAGVYTDTAEFVSIVPECTNLSVGYFSQHTAWEIQNVSFMNSLIENLCNVMWEELPTARTPVARTFRTYTTSGYGIYGYGTTAVPTEEENDVVDSGYGHYDMSDFYFPTELTKEEEEAAIEQVKMCIEVCGFKATNEVDAYHDAGFIAGGLKALAREFLLAFDSGDAAAVSDIAELAEFYGVLHES